MTAARQLYGCLSDWRARCNELGHGVWHHQRHSLRSFWLWLARVVLGGLGAPFLGVLLRTPDTLLSSPSALAGMGLARYGGSAPPPSPQRQCSTLPEHLIPCCTYQLALCVLALGKQLSRLVMEGAWPSPWAARDTPGISPPPPFRYQSRAGIVPHELHKMPSDRMGVGVWCRLDIALGDWRAVKAGLKKAKQLCEQGGDWERKNKLKVRFRGSKGVGRRQAACVQLQNAWGGALCSGVAQAFSNICMLFRKPPDALLC